MVFSFIDKVIVEMKLSLNYKCIAKKKEVKVEITYSKRGAASALLN